MATQPLTANAPVGVIHPTIRHINLADVRAALSEGYGDFRANPTHLIFLCLIYPIMGLLLGRMASGSDSLPLIYPLIGGFALIGPLASVGLYELSRRRENGQSVSVSNAFDIFGSRRFPAILMLGVVFVAIFVVWLGVAQAIFDATMPPASTDTIGGMINIALTTSAGWRLIILGTGVGMVFAIASLTIGVVSFPLLVDRDLGGTSLDQAATAIRASIAATAANPIAICAWGLIVAASLAIGVATLLVGLAVLMPILGHATWHLYRKLVA